MRLLDWYGQTHKLPSQIAITGKIRCEKSMQIKKGYMLKILTHIHAASCMLICVYRAFNRSTCGQCPSSKPIPAECGVKQITLQPSSVKWFYDQTLTFSGAFVFQSLWAWHNTLKLAFTDPPSVSDPCIRHLEHVCDEVVLTDTRSPHMKQGMFTLRWSVERLCSCCCCFP